MARTPPWLGDRPGWSRPWHRLGFIGAHRPAPMLALGPPPLTPCLDCWWVGLDLGSYAEALGTSAEELAGRWVWMPRRVWQKALERAW